MCEKSFKTLWPTKSNFTSHHHLLSFVFSCHFPSYAKLKKEYTHIYVNRNKNVPDLASVIHILLSHYHFQMNSALQLFTNSITNESHDFQP